YGLCYTFNANSSTVKMVDAGKRQGLQLRLDAQPHEYYGPFSYDATGFKIAIHEPGTFHDIDNGGYDVSPGFYTSIRIRRKKTIYKPPPFVSKCGSKKLDNFERYTQHSCLHECFSRSLAKKCNCRQIGTVEKGINISRFCNSTERRNCINPAIRKLKITAETCGCPLECESIEYSAWSSIAYHPSETLLDAMIPYLEKVTGLNASDPQQKEKIQTIIRKRNSAVSIFFENLSTDVIEEKVSYDVSDMTSDIGGNMGLFLGCSLLTVCEFIDLVVMVCLKRWRKKATIEVNELTQDQGAVTVSAWRPGCRLVEYKINYSTEVYALTCFHLMIEKQDKGVKGVVIPHAVKRTNQLQHNGEVERNHGLCYTFNANSANRSTLKLVGAGKRQGLTLRLDAQPHEYYGPYSYDATGFKIAVHEPGTFHDIDDEGYDVSPGFYTSIRIRRKKTVTKPPPYQSMCGSKKLENFERFSQESCFMECMSQTLAKECNCRVIGMVEKGINVTRFCNVTEISKCIFPTFNKLETSAETCGCPLECESIRYSIQTSIAYYPSEHLWDSLVPLMANLTGLNATDPKQKEKIQIMLRKQIAVVTIFFENLITDVTAEKARYTLSDLGTDIGGNMGLFLGCSLLTVCEFIDLVVMVCLKRWRKKATIEVKELTQDQMQGAVKVSAWST
ncbi:hypothetical protein QZH41_016538, partial [Actinostola sp. cb2023]